MSDIIKIGTQDVTLKVGSSPVTAAYLGSTQVYPQGEPPTPVGFKYKLTLNNGDVVSAACDGTSAITQSEISAYTASTVAAEIGNFVTTIDDSAFDSFSSLSSVTFGSGIITIGYSAFYECTSLQSIDLPSGITIINDSTFYNCYNLTSITIPDSVEEIGVEAFAECTNLSSVTIGNGVTIINAYAFNGCTSLTNIDVPDSVTRINAAVFMNCTSLTSANIGSGVTFINNMAFYRCSGLTGITIEATTPPQLGTNVFNNTNNCPIYVDCSVVEDFKTAWSAYASRITCIPTHEYVDLGLPSGTLWATMNVGAESETDYGNYYQYGKGADDYSVTSGQSDYSGTEDPLAASADTATQVWGGNWHTPTSAQCQELIANTTYSFEFNFNGSGINGGKFTAQNGNYVFFPAGGYFKNGSKENGDYYGYCCVSTPKNNYSYYLYFSSTGTKAVNFDIRGRGYLARPVIG